MWRMLGCCGLLVIRGVRVVTVAPGVRSQGSGVRGQGSGAQNRHSPDQGAELSRKGRGFFNIEPSILPLRLFSSVSNSGEDLNH